jgi:hypothetical protein
MATELAASRVVLSSLELVIFIFAFLFNGVAAPV